VILDFRFSFVSSSPLRLKAPTHLERRYQFCWKSDLTCSKLERRSPSPPDSASASAFWLAISPRLNSCGMLKSHPFEPYGFVNALCGCIQVLLLGGSMNNEGRKSLSSIRIFLNRSESSRVGPKSHETAGGHSIRNTRTRRMWTVGLSCSGGSSLVGFALLSLIAKVIRFLSTK
jgi:hypothetical protein